MTKIKNINGTSDNVCLCGSWLKHWGNFSVQVASKCSVIDCYQTNNLVGAHVQIVDYFANWFIVPLCQRHNMSQGELEIANHIETVSANKSETCARI